MSLMIEGGRRLSGDLTVQGAKNSVLPILAACILSGDVCVLQRCPHLEDVDTSIDILRHLGCAVRWNGRPGPSTCICPPCGLWGPASGRRAAA